jgi:hypothetical protein
MKILQYDTLAQLVSTNSLKVKKKPKTIPKDFQLDQFLYSQAIAQDHIQVSYKTKGKKELQSIYISKNPKNFGGGSIDLPPKSTKVLLSTKIAAGNYVNTWIAIQFRSIYMPKLTVNGIKHNPVEVNGAYLKYQFVADNENVLKKLTNDISITCNLNLLEHTNSIVGIWFG